MNTLKALLVLTLICLPWPAQAINRLSENDLKLMITHMQQAIKRKDANSLLSYFTGDALITLDMPAQFGGKQVMKLPQYKATLIQAWKQFPTSSIEIRDIKIKLAADGKSATITDLTIEKIPLNGKTITGKTQEKLAVVLLKGQARIKSLYGKTTLE